ncbi:glycosyltransferase family 4 protein [Pseudonocardia bannensis]|uniref:Glycosyltransferase family 4 protein n=1 Tax=Pseudonocardia bannensis TaxID=630973 RepID=A0A848DD35_9PSEU|nr:glycosyltransferase family 4 protein [Pseudonocardia bannensis]NMH90528.1 glycosyltransferase family 4 protein [Pseudonocardia bannensis]
MADPTGRRVAILSYRLGMADGVSVAAAQWESALRRLGMRVRTVAGAGRPDVIVRGLALDSRQAPSRRELEAVLDGADIVVVDNLCSLPMNPRVGEAVAAYLAGRPAVLRHHDLPWERERYAATVGWPPDDPAWRHVTINELARRSLAERGVSATTIYHGFDVRPRPEHREPLRARLRIGDGPLVLQPTRAIARKNVSVGLALTAALGGTYWLTGPVEDGYQAGLNGLLRATTVPVRRRLPFGVGMDSAYAACDVVVLPSSWEGFGLPLIESALHRRPIAVAGFPVARELAAFGFRWFDPATPEPLRAWLADPDPELLDHNEAIARRFFGLDVLSHRLRLLLSGAPVGHHPSPAHDEGYEGCDCSMA